MPEYLSLETGCFPSPFRLYADLFAFPHNSRMHSHFFAKNDLTSGAFWHIINTVVKRSAGVAHLVERHLAKVEVASSSLVVRSKQWISVLADVHCFY